MVTDSEYEKIKAKEVHGRYVTNEHVVAHLSNIKDSIEIENLGESVEGRTIQSVAIGDGPIRIFMWSQMHGNESTTTKAVLDLLNYLVQGQGLSKSILEACSIKFIPILNPDGAKAYTRVNANEVDLNRDAKALSQPESVLLRNVFDSFKPNFAFNLHGQRTIYNVGKSNRPATLSFLSPSVDESRTLSDSRITAMQLICAMNELLQKMIPGGVGRYDDSFNRNCVGDTFQSLKCPTVLFEAGHFQDDYQREKVRKLLFLSILKALETIGKDAYSNYPVGEYFAIPENGKLFFDVLVRNVKAYNANYIEGDSVGILFEEVLKDGNIEFVPKIEETGQLEFHFGHKTYDCHIERELLELKSLPLICSVINNI